MSRRNKPRGKKINPAYWVFCEGKTEESYIAFLKTKYRLPIEIISKVTGSSINSNYIKKTKQGKPTDSKDRDFLMYDGDVTSIIDQLKKIDKATMIISNPSIELWFLFHYKNQKASITVEECIRELCKRNRTQYMKGVLDRKLMEKPGWEYKKACERAKESGLFNNPSSNVFELIEALEEVKKAK